MNDASSNYLWCRRLVGAAIVYWIGSVIGLALFSEDAPPELGATHASSALAVAIDNAEACHHQRTGRFTGNPLDLEETMYRLAPSAGA